MKKLVIATGNPGKVREIKKILEGVYDEICSLKDEGIAVDIVEDADSFLGNAAKKALTISRLVDCDVLADDSGLCVDGLGGRPGVYSARIPQAERMRTTIRSWWRNAPRWMKRGRRASYVCAIVLARGGQEIYSCEGKCYGRIVLEAHGNGGFGYDPYFYLPEYGQTFGELPAEEKNKISHRALALKKVQEFLQK